MAKPVAMDDTANTITVAQAASMLGVSERTVWRYLKSGRLTGDTIGPTGSQRTLIHPASVQALQRSRTADPDADRLRAQVERLTQQLAQVTSERDALEHRVTMMQHAFGRGAPEGILGRAAVGVVSAVARIRAVRAA